MKLLEGIHSSLGYSILSHVQVISTPNPRRLEIAVEYKSSISCTPTYFGSPATMSLDEFLYSWRTCLSILDDNQEPCDINGSLQLVPLLEGGNWVLRAWTISSTICVFREYPTCLSVASSGGSSFSSFVASWTQSRVAAVFLFNINICVCTITRGKKIGTAK